VPSQRFSRVGLGAAAIVAVVGLMASADPPYTHDEATASADAALVASGDVDYLRVRRAAGLYRERAVGWLLLTGAGAGGDSAAAMGALARSLGVPQARLVLEDRSRSTRENFAFAAPLIRAHGWRRVAIVTSVSHMARAKWVATKVLPDVDWVAVPVPNAGPGRRCCVRTRLTEWTKIGWYALRGWI